MSAPEVFPPTDAHTGMGSLCKQLSSLVAGAGAAGEASCLQSSQHEADVSFEPDIRSESDTVTKIDDADSASMSGYSAGVAESMDPQSHLARLMRFYAKYNPAKISRAEEFLAAYRGEEEELFKALTGKYGPEPPTPRRVPHEEINESFHFLGSGVQLPEKVSPHDGRTEGFTPYWPACKTVAERDVLEMFLRRRTENLELRKCFIGSIQTHPQQAWNGMTYITTCPLPAHSDKPFLGHRWSGALADNRTLMFRGEAFRRTVLRCTEECCTHSLPPLRDRKNASSPTASNNSGREGSSGRESPSGSFGSKRPSSLDDAAAVPTGHGRWRLTIYHTETCPYALFRIMYDPVLHPHHGNSPEKLAHAEDRPHPAAPLEPQASGAANGPSGPPPASGSPLAPKSFFSFSFSRKKRALSAAGQREPQVESSHMRSARMANRDPSADADVASLSTTSSRPEADRSQMVRSKFAVTQQPQQPVASQAAAAPNLLVAPLFAAMAEMERRINERIDNLSARVTALEAWHRERPSAK